MHSRKSREVFKDQEFLKKIVRNTMDQQVINIDLKNKKDVNDGEDMPTKLSLSKTASKIQKLNSNVQGENNKKQMSRVNLNNRLSLLKKKDNEQATKF